MPITADELHRHFLTAWGPDTCYPNMSEEWTPENPARDQCGMTALVVQDVFTPANGYPPGLEVDGIPLLDQVWFERVL